MDSVNVSAHHDATAVDLFLSADTENVKIGITNSLFYDNKKGGLRFSGSFRSPRAILRGCRFSRNFGETIQFEKFGNASLIVDKCTFLSNSYLDFDRGDSVISLKNVQGNDNELSISNCQFTKNTVHDVITIFDNSTATPSTTHISIMSNKFIQNLANSVITTNFPNVSVTENKFQDKRSTCEITYHPPASPKSEDLLRNTMVAGQQIYFALKNTEVFNGSTCHV
uniref:Right handed beta helix domain-containing protein n=1 Tax=Caenorhabditis japonica TaxID=281687 RepID=A0A8R1IV89_CAEJA